MFRFTIRDVLLVTVIVVVAVSWFVDHSKSRLEVGRARAQAERAEQREAMQREERHWAEVRAVKLAEQRVKILRTAAEKMTPDDFREAFPANPY